MNSFVKGKALKVNDKVYTPEKWAKKIIALYNIKENETILDAFAGGGVFYNNYPFKNYDLKNTFWCEIDREKDFFDWDKKVDWIITNPPYSLFDEIIEHSIKISNNIVYLIPIIKLFASMKRLRQISNYGGIVSIHYFSASKAGFPFGFPACAIHIKKGYKGKTLIKEI